MPLRSLAALAELLAALAFLAGAAPAAGQPSEVGGFRLGQERQEVSQAAQAALDPGRCAVTRVEGADYRFHFTPAGRLYRVEARRDLGPAVFSEALRADFLERITEQHGAPDVAESHSGYVRAIWGRPGEARRVIKLTPADPAAGASPVIMRENLLDPALLRQDGRILSTGPTPTVGERFVTGGAAPPSVCGGRLRPSDEGG